MESQSQNAATGVQHRLCMLHVVSLVSRCEDPLPQVPNQLRDTTISVFELLPPIVHTAMLQELGIATPDAPLRRRWRRPCCDASTPLKAYASIVAMRSCPEELKEKTATADALRPAYEFKMALRAKVIAIACTDERLPALRSAPM
jgi:hypothetical protein